ncbi:GNAT family N-acetyltransferase [Deinococcus aquiradiocola]|uniref:Ribosomal protein N-acetyltransferase n=1 Tax=Deinococcus aquiradiocola TaxID=393059 RepID=A0A917P6A8_9DEIO|nr:GNAT family N-acetyltransferase [Deinococcus aquiradiocola]GGJ63817.1 ribosomal protein N-acetyltransferase [Deinococcus aquiradiocola]
MLPDTVPTEIRTGRLLLRAPAPQDGPALSAAVNASRPELRRWMRWAHEPLDDAAATLNLTRAAARFADRSELRSLIWDARGRTLLGSSGFHALDWEVPKGEVGYWVHSAHTGHGYATQVARTLAEVGVSVLGLRRVELRCDALNVASAAVARRAGFGVEGLLRHDERASDGSGALRDMLLHAVVR